jgi:hypothetical protein
VAKRCTVFKYRHQKVPTCRAFHFTFYSNIDFQWKREIEEKCGKLQLATLTTSKKINKPFLLLKTNLYDYFQNCQLFFFGASTI